MPKVDVVYSGSSPATGLILNIPDEGTLTLGTISVALPAADGVYTLDAINVGAPDTYTGARIDYGFESRTTVHTLNGNLQGGTLEFAVPEPTTFALLGIGLAGLGIVARPRFRNQSSSG